MRVFTKLQNLLFKPRYGEHPHAKQLEAISELLEHNPDIERLAHEDVTRGRRTDVGRPGMSGDQVFPNLRSCPQTRALEVDDSTEQHQAPTVSDTRGDQSDPSYNSQARQDRERQQDPHRLYSRGEQHPQADRFLRELVDSLGKLGI